MRAGIEAVDPGGAANYASLAKLDGNERTAIIRTEAF